MKNRSNFFFVVLLCFCANNLFAQSDDPIIPASGLNVQVFIPKGWKKILESTGDLNKDGLADKAIVIENMDARNVIANESFGPKQLNLNYRILLVLFKTSADSYQLAVKNYGFIPSENQEESPCLADPLMPEGGISIEKGLLIIHYQYFYSCGSWHITNKDYTFRFQQQKFLLIGYDDYSLHRSSGDQYITSINFLTKKRSDTTGGNEFNEKENKAKTIWKTIKITKLLDLATFTEEIFEQILE